MPTGVAWLPFGHQRLRTLDNVPHTVDEALFLRWQDELIVHLEGKVTSLNCLKGENFEFCIWLTVKIDEHLVDNTQHREHSRNETAVPEQYVSKR